MSLVDDNDMVQTVTADGSNNAFTKRILPWRARRRDNLLDTQTPDPSMHLLTINRIPIMQKVAWSRVERKSLHQLLRCPLSSGMRCHIEVHDVTTVMADILYPLREIVNNINTIEFSGGTGGLAVQASNLWGRWKTKPQTKKQPSAAVLYKSQRTKMVLSHFLSR